MVSKKTNEYFKETCCPICKSKNFTFMFSKIDGHTYLYEKGEDPLSFSIVKCNTCKLQYMNPTLTTKGLEKIYTKDYADSWDIEKMKTQDKDLYIRSFVKRMSHIQKITSLKKGNLLDFGCGRANFIKNAKKNFENWDFYGFDFNKDISIQKSSVKIYLGKNIVATEIPKDHFDVVTLIETIEHFTDLEIIETISKYIKKGGYLYVETGNQESLFARILKRKHNYYEVYHTIYFSPRIMKILLKENGFEIVKISDYPINFNLLDLKTKFSIGKLFKGLLYYVLSKIKIGNFSITGGMCVIARKK